MKKVLSALFLTVGLSASAMADWALDSDASTLNFISVKAVDIAEVHQFHDLSGRLSDKGKAVVAIDLTSVDTGIEIRDDRMQEMLFEVEKFPLATVRAKIDMDWLNAIGTGSSASTDIECELEMHGNTVTMTANVMVSRIAENYITVVSARPLIVKAADYAMSDGIEELRKVANLPSIGSAVPVSFVLTLNTSE